MILTEAQIAEIEQRQVARVELAIHGTEGLPAFVFNTTVTLTDVQRDALCAMARAHLKALAYLEAEALRLRERYDRYNMGAGVMQLAETVAAVLRGER